MPVDYSPYSIADAVLAQLAAGGVQRIYGVVGDAIFPLADAFTRQDSLRFVPVGHEGAAAFMASYEAKLTGRLTGCLATSGPGATNLATGLADAYFDNAPVIAITGQVVSGKIGTQTHQYFNQQSYFAPITAFTTLTVSPEATMPALVEAMCQAVEIGTATHISIPKDIQSMPVAWSPLPIKVPSSADQPDVITAPEDIPARLIIGDRQKAQAALAACRRPLLLLGLDRPQAVTAALQLAEKLGAAIIIAQQVKGAVSSSHPQVIGGIGPAYVPGIVGQVDLIILIGDASYEIGYLPPGIQLIAVTERPIIPPGLPLLVELIGPPAAMLHRLSQESALTKREPSPEWLSAISATRQELTKQAEQVNSSAPDGAINPYHLAVALERVLDRNAIIAIDIGAFSHWFDLGFKAHKQVILTSARWRGMGLGLPAAVAAKIVHPERQVAAVIGDGAFVMSMSELLTACRLQLPILIVIVDNSGYDLEKQKMQAEGLTPYGVDLNLPDMTALATAWGAYGYRVRPGDKLEEALREAIGEMARRKGPVVLVVPCATPALPHIRPER
jgi:pyruvate oxidase